MTTQKKGSIASIKRYMIHDGPGIRSVVFMKGCPLRCLWCSSPQTWRVEPSVIFVKSRCIECGRCVTACPVHAIDDFDGLKTIDRATCNRCGQCTDICPTEALTYDGTEMTVSDVMEIIERDRDFYDTSGGGVTFSGGEPCFQWEFLLELLKVCNDAAIHTALETTGEVEWESFAKLLPFVDLLLYDVKHMDSTRHEELTGKGNQRIQENLKRIAGMKNPPVEIHFPLIPGKNDSKQNIDELLATMEALGLKRIDIFPFHLLGSHEYEELGLDYAMKNTVAPTDEHIAGIKEYIDSRGFELVT
jgi:pyruvate formate lyase activating enzyme